MRQRRITSHRPSRALRAAAAVAAAAPVLALAPAAQAAPGDTPRPDLVVSELPTTGWEPGTVRHDILTFTNRGTAAAHSVVLRVRLTRGLDFPEAADGCAYTTEADQVHQALCRLDVTVEPGAAATVPLPIKVLPKALMESVEYGTSSTGEEPGEGFTDSYRQANLTADNTADLAAVGDRAEGGQGQTVTITPALRNDGPGWVRNSQSDDQPALMVKIPKGTTAVQVPSECVPFAIDGPSGPSAPGKPQYVCFPSDQTLEVGSTHTYTFKLRIDDVTGSSSGEVKATSVYDIHPEFGHNAANDTAAVDVQAHQDADAGTGAAHDSGTAGDATPAGASGHPANHARTADHALLALSSTLSATAAKSGSLAGTGAGATPLAAGTAAAATGLGGVLVATARRRHRNRS